MGPPAPVGEARGRWTASGSAAGKGDIQALVRNAAMATVCNLDGDGPSAPDAVRHDDGGEGEGESAKDSSHLDRVGAQFNGGARVWTAPARAAPRSLAWRGDQPAARHDPDHGVGAVGPLVGPEPGDPGVRRWFGRLRQAFGSDGWAGGLQHVEGAGPAPPVRQGGVGRPSPAGTHGTPGGAAPPGRTRPPPPGPGSGRASLPSAPRGDRTSTSSRKGPRRPVSPQS